MVSRPMATLGGREWYKVISPNPRVEFDLFWKRTVAWEETCFPVGEWYRGYTRNGSKAARWMFWRGQENGYILQFPDVPAWHTIHCDSEVSLVDVSTCYGSPDDMSPSLVKRCERLDGWRKVCWTMLHQWVIAHFSVHHLCLTMCFPTWHILCVYWPEKIAGLRGVPKKTAVSKEKNHWGPRSCWRLSVDHPDR